MAEVAVPRKLFAAILDRIQHVHAVPAMASRRESFVSLAGRKKLEGGVCAPGGAGKMAGHRSAV